MPLIFVRWMSFQCATPPPILVRQPLKPKGKGKGIMVSGFLTPGGRLQVPDHIPDSELLQDPQWVKVDGKPVRDAMWLLEHGKITTGRVIRW